VMQRNHFQIFRFSDFQVPDSQVRQLVHSQTPI
jgi:hypothetical protein